MQINAATRKDRKRICEERRRRGKKENVTEAEAENEREGICRRSRTAQDRRTEGEEQKKGREVAFLTVDLDVASVMRTKPDKCQTDKHRPNMVETAKKTEQNGMKNRSRNERRKEGTREDGTAWQNERENERKQNDRREQNRTNERTRARRRKEEETKWKSNVERTLFEVPH